MSELTWTELDRKAVDTARVLAFTSLSMIPALIFFSLFMPATLQVVSVPGPDGALPFRC